MWKVGGIKIRQQHSTKKIACGHPNSWKMKIVHKIGPPLHSSPRNSSNSVISSLTKWFIMLAIFVETGNSNSNMNVPIKFEIHSQKQKTFLVCLYPDLEFEFTLLQEWISENERFSCWKCGYEFHIVRWWLSCDKIDTGQDDEEGLHGDANNWMIFNHGLYCIDKRRTRKGSVLQILALFDTFWKFIFHWIGSKNDSIQNSIQNKIQNIHSKKYSFNRVQNIQ